MRPDEAYVNAYTSALASAAGGFITETPAAATRPTTGEANLFDWDSTFANNFEYTVLGEGSHKLSSTDSGFKVWLITARPRPAIAVSGSMGFGVRFIKSRTRRSFTIRNPGSAPLQVSGIRYPSGYIGAWTGAIAAGASRSILVTFLPLRAKRYSGEIVVNSNANRGTNRLRISGVGKVRRRD